MERYRDIEGLGKVKRLIVGLGRIGESEDDELAYAYHAANNRGEPYDRKRCSRAYMSVAYGYYQRHHVERAVTLVLKAVGIRRSEEHTSELQSLMRISFAVFCLKKKKKLHPIHRNTHQAK